MPVQHHVTPIVLGHVTRHEQSEAAPADFISPCVHEAESGVK